MKISSAAECGRRSSLYSALPNSRPREVPRTRRHEQGYGKCCDGFGVVAECRQRGYEPAATRATTPSTETHSPPALENNVRRVLMPSGPLYGSQGWAKIFILIGNGYVYTQRSSSNPIQHAATSLRDYGCTPYHTGRGMGHPIYTERDGFPALLRVARAAEGPSRSIEGSYRGAEYNSTSQRV